MIKKNLITILYHLIPFVISLILAYAFVNLDFMYDVTSGEYTWDEFFNNEGGLDVVVLDVLFLWFVYSRGLAFFGVFHAANAVEKFEDSIQPFTNALTVAHGPPGSGKSSSTGYTFVVSARIMEFELKWKYKTMSFRAAEIEAGDNEQLKRDWHNVKESYEFYSAHNGAWCAAANVPMTIKGKYVYELEYEHSTMEKRLPAYTVLYYDEAGAIFDNLMHRKKGAKNDPYKILSVSDFYRLIRQFGYCAYMCEQSETGIFKDIRNITAVNRSYTSQIGVGRAKMLIKIYEKIRERYVYGKKGNLNMGPKMFKFVVKLKYLIDHIGFRRYVYRDLGNTESIASSYTISGQKLMYLPAPLNYKYDDKCFRNLNEALLRDISLDIWEVMTIPPGDKRYLHSRFTNQNQENN